MVDIVYSGQVPQAVIGDDEMPSNVDLRLYKGDARRFSLELTDNADQPVDLVSNIPKAQLRETYATDVVIELQCSVSNGNRIEVYIPSSISKLLTGSTSYIWDLQTTDYNGDVQTWITGDVDVMDEVTR